MTFRTLIRRNLRFHWRAHLGVVLGAAVGSAALIGALVVGDSVRESLRERALARFGRIFFVLDARDRTFKTDLPSRILFDVSQTPSTNRAWSHVFDSMLRVEGIAARADGSARANQVSVMGVSPVRDSLRGWPITSGSRSAWMTNLHRGGLFCNERLAKQLNLSIGDEVILRLQNSASLSQEFTVSRRAVGSIALRLTVQGIIAAAGDQNGTSMAEFDPQPNQNAPLNAYVQMDELSQALGIPNRANIILGNYGWRRSLAATEYQILVFLNKYAGIPWPRRDFTAVAPYEMNQILGDVWKLEDAEYSMTARPADGLELRTPRVFLESPIVRAALAVKTNAQPILTLLANLLRAGTNATPYSMVTAAGAPWTPADLRDDEIVVSQWLAEDLRVKPGDEIAMSYFLPESGAKLTETTNTFRVRSIVPLEMPWADRTLMPDFQGIEKAESTSEWDAGFPLTYKVRDKDDDYWKQYRGTPKAFITLAAGQKMWVNRFGNLTAIRFPIPTNSIDPNFKADLEKKILANIKPEELGLRFEPVREQAFKAAEESQDFGGLFLGFSFFLIIAALLLMAMLFQFGLEQRAPEIGTLLALGFTPKQVRKLLLREGVALAFLGGVIGAVGGIYFAKAMLHGLTTVWRDAVGATALNFHFTGQTLVIGIFASVAVSAVTIWLALRKFVKRPARELLVGEVQNPESRVQSRAWGFGVIALVAALGLVGWTLAKGDTANAGAFFGAGALVLAAGLSFVSAWLEGLVGSPLTLALAPSDGETENRRQSLDKSGAVTTTFTLCSLGVRGCARRRKRSLATVAMLACGSFLIVSIGVFRLDANRDASKKNSGTGGFRLIGETTMPVVQDLNSKSGREFFALNEADLNGVDFIPFRVREGDEASCLNLNAAQRPRLLGVKPELLDGRFWFCKKFERHPTSKFLVVD